ncbi:Conserved_hypothetical protein [Hexamita inflata]|uniref:Uncharacterized protein n=1 Tax=Hexamita inflata TaxID=28002 RepID=A0AA86UCM4_9EUKA|nr:Conserved hypothetical protein [Hexamita inflata]
MNISKQLGYEDNQQNQYEKHLPRIKNGILKIKKDQYVTDLSFMQHFQLKELYITKCHCIQLQQAFSETCSILLADKCKIKNLSGIDQNTSLRSLYLSDNLLENLEPLRNMILLDNLTLNNNKIADISSLNHLTNLKFLNISNNIIANLSTITKLHNLEILTVSKNKLTSLHGIQNLKSLKSLYVDNCKVTDLYGIQHLKYLSYVQLQNNQITDLSPLSGCCSLKILHAGNNLITSVSPLISHSQYAQFKYVAVELNYITDIQLLNSNLHFNKFSFCDQKLPNQSQIQIAQRMRTIYTTRVYFESLKQKHRQISMLHSSTLSEVKIFKQSLINVQLNLSNRLLLVFEQSEHEDYLQ